MNANAPRPRVPCSYCGRVILTLANPNPARPVSYSASCECMDVHVTSRRSRRDAIRHYGRALVRARLAYALTMREGGKRTVVFLGSDFSPSPTDAIDSDDAVASLLCFLTLRPGDTDSDYFASYTPDQMDFATKYAEALSIAAYDRFGER